ncbi:MAG: tetratricopeptide repeat protein [candidate division WOR-3 bacterium]|nr:tetratricopeptide repeat protein [candidate division WOR-3 bacterium]
MVERKNDLWIIALFLIFALAFFLSLRKIYDTDIGFHLRGGEWMLENKSFHRYDQFTYTVPHHEYIAMYWLYQIILFFIFKLSGDGGISIFNSLLILILFFLIYLRLRSFSIPTWLICFLLLLCVFTFEIRFGVRPEIFTYLFMVLMLFILDLFYYSKKDYLYFLPVIQLLWVNIHGLFILGWLIMLAYVASAFFQNKKKFKNLLIWTSAAIIISFLNPYHFKGIAFPFYLLTRLQESSIFKQGITEFASPFSARGFMLTPDSALYGYFFCIASSALLLAITKRKIHDYLLLSAFGYLSFTAVRNIPLFIIVAIPIISTGFSELITKIKKPLKFFDSVNNPLALITCIFSLLFSIFIINNGYYALRGGGKFGIGFDPDVQPIKACDFIVKNNLRGRILNDLNRGSWLIWAVREPVYIDGRLEVMKEELFKEFHESYQPGGVTKLIEKYQPSLIIFDYSYPEAMFWDMDLEKLPDWRLIYWDETSVIYAKKGYAEDFKPINLFNTIQQLGIETEIDQSQAWNILRKPGKSIFILFFEGLYRKQTYPAVLTRMAFYASIKLDLKSAEILYLNALKIADYHLPTIYLRLGLIYHFLQKFDRAEYCYQRVLREHPDHKKARDLLNRLKMRLPPLN